MTDDQQQPKEYIITGGMLRFFASQSMACEQLAESARPYQQPVTKKEEEEPLINAMMKDYSCIFYPMCFKARELLYCPKKAGKKDCEDYRPSPLPANYDERLDLNNPLTKAMWASESEKHDMQVALDARKQAVYELWVFCIANGAERHGDIVGLPKDPFFPLKLLKRIAEMTDEFVGSRS